MLTQPYNYVQRRGIIPISWDTFHGLCKGLAMAVCGYAPDLILAIGRGGHYPGTLLAHLLRVELYPIRLSRRKRDEVAHRIPRWLVAPPPQVWGARVLIVDEIADTGETLRLAASKVRALAAADVRCAVLYAHSTGEAAADYIGLISDALIVNPWDREILAPGGFSIHPEYLAALESQGLMAGEIERPPEALQIAKAGSV